MPPSFASAASLTFSPTERSGKTLETWNERPSPACVRRCGGSRVTSFPSSSTLPAVGRIVPESRLKSVVLPAPFGPMMPTSSPARTSSETSATMRAPPMSSPRSRVARIGACVDTIPVWKGCLARTSSPGAPCTGRGAHFVGTEFHLPFFWVSLTWNIGWSIAWSEARIVSWPFGPVKLQPSSAEIILSTSVGEPFVSARTIICPATNPSGVNRSGTWLRLRIERTRKSFTLFFGAL